MTVTVHLPAAGGAQRTRDQAHLWAITCYFNPAGYRSRLTNYRIFRRSLKSPLITVELSSAADFALQPGDADVLVQIHGGDILWQKERLLGIALRHVPDRCNYVAWLDCDVVFERPDWDELARLALQRFPIVQLFRRRCNLTRDAVANGLDLGQIDSSVLSMGYKIVQHQVTADDLRIPGASTTGIAWAARAEVLRDHGLYDACILGSGDRALVCAAVGECSSAVDGLQMTAPQAEHYLQWARPFSETIAGRVGYIDGRIFHLWHGALAHRRYVRRFQGLRIFEFDPFVDIAKDASLVWRWNSDKRPMHEYVRRYFETRHEDG